MSINDQNLSKEKLLAEVERLKKELKNRKKYGLVWEDKPEEVVEMCKKRLPVLKEVKEKEIITDKSKPVNLLIEGDNYHALSVLNYTHAGKIDVIYIDPPYNTGNKDFIFNDNYVDREDSYRHSKWLSFMEKRLKLAKNLLKDTGVIFISIDDNEMAHLKLLMDNPDLFGEQKFYALLTWINRTKPTNMGEARFNIQQNVEYILVYGKVPMTRHPRFNLFKDQKKSYLYEDRIGRYRVEEIVQRRNLGVLRRDTMIYPLLGISPKKGYRWQLSRMKYKELLAKNRLRLTKGKPYRIIYDFEEDVFAYRPFWSHLEDVGTAETGKMELNDILGIGHEFETVKPKELIKRILFHSTDENSVILDFFAGSGTTGHAVLELNREDNGNRKFILCTNNEDNNGNGYKIAEDICYPRTKKVIEGYTNLKGEKVDGLGGNLKYFKTDFVDYEKPTDKNKIKLTKQAIEMLCIKEGTFEKVIDNERFKIFKNSNHYTGIIWDQTAIPEFKKKIKDIKGKFSVYIFSLGDETFDDEFEDVKQKVKLSPIPEAILRVYRRIFK